MKASKIADWKRNLTGALDERRLFLSLVALSLFYVGYVLFNAILNNNANDEDSIVQNCTCKPTHRKFYIGWSSFCYFLWFCFHMMIFFIDEFAPTKRCKKWCCKHADTSSYSFNDNSPERFQECKAFLPQGLVACFVPRVFIGTKVTCGQDTMNCMW